MISISYLAIILYNLSMYLNHSAYFGFYLCLSSLCWHHSWVDQDLMSVEAKVAEEGVKQHSHVVGQVR